jgi:predicted site-specific integrase-resolvase
MLNAAKLEYLCYTLPMKLSQYAKQQGIGAAITHIVVEHKDRITRFGFRCLETLLELAGQHIEAITLTENVREDLLADLASIIYSFAARLYGQR